MMILARYEYYRPSTVEEAVSMLKKENTIIAGGSDVMPQLKTATIAPEALIDLSKISEMHTVEETDDGIYIGAMVTLSHLAKNELILRKLVALSQAARNVASPQIRNRGTLGGSISTSSPAGDVYPPLLALCGAAEVMNSHGAVRTIPARELVLGKGKTALASDEAILRFLLPLPTEHEISAFDKIGERHQVTISKINLAVSAVVENGCIQRARAALGAVAPHAYLSEDAAAFLGGKPLTAETGAALGDLLSSKVERVIAGRGSMPYKREAVRCLAQDVFARLIALAQERGL